MGSKPEGYIGHSHFDSSANYHGPLSKVFMEPAFQVLFLLVILLVTLIIASTPSEGSITGDTPPSIGDWTIGNSTSVVDESITVRGDVSVGSDLTLKNATLTIISSSQGAHGIVVNSTGKLKATDSIIRSSGSNRFTFVVRGQMDLERVTVTGIHGGIRVETDQVVVVEACLITDFSAYAFHLEEANKTVLKDVRVQASNMYYRLTVSAWPASHDERVVVHKAPRGVVRIDGGRPILDGMDISINATADILVNVTKDYRIADVELVCDWPVVEVATKDRLTISNVHLRDTILDLTAWFHVTNRASGGVALLTASQSSGVVSIRDHRNVTVEGVSMDGIVYNDPLIRASQANFLLDDLQTDGRDMGSWLVQVILREYYYTRGPHDYILCLRDIDAGANRLLEHRLEPMYWGTQVLTFSYDVLLENITSRSGKDLVRFYTRPRFGTTKYFEPVVTVTDSVFEDVRGYVLRVENELGLPTVVKSNILTGQYRMDNSTFRGCRLGPVGLVSIPEVHWGGGPSQDMCDTEVSVVDCTFADNIGRLIHAGGTTGPRKDHDSLYLLNCHIFNNTCLFGEELINVSERATVEIANNTFEDNTVSRGIMLTDLGWNGDFRDLCNFTIVDNTFRNNTASGNGSYPRAFIDVWWGGNLEVANNTIEGTASYFINLTEMTYLSQKSVLDLHHNLIHNNTRMVVHFRQTDRDHTRLVATIRDNVARDNLGPIVGYLASSPYILSHDYDATYNILDNLVVRNNVTAFEIYGNITVKGNTFKDCKGWAFQIDSLHWHAPVFVDNIISGCENGIRVRTKPGVVVQVLLWVDNTEIDCTGIGLHFTMMEVTMRNSTISPNTGTAVMADVSMVDMYNCHLEVGSARVITDGYVKAWHWVEAEVQWANASGDPSGNPVPEARVSFYDASGTWTTTVLTDALGQMERTEVLHWELGRSGSHVVRSPYRVVTSVSSYTTGVQVHVNRSYLGSEDLDLLLVDPSVPVIILQSPMDGDALNAKTLEVKGFAEDLGSGLLVLQVAVGNSGYSNVDPNETGVFQYVHPNVPEGIVIVRVRAFDMALNLRIVRVEVIIDQTPPRLIVTVPEDGIITNEPSLMVWGETERGAMVKVNLWSRVSENGEFFTQVILMEGKNRLEISASDRVGNTAWLNLTVTLDTILPVFDIMGPDDGLVTNRTLIDVVGRVFEPSFMTVTLHRQHTDIIDEPIDVDPEGYFAPEVELEVGWNTIIVTAVDPAGNLYSVSMMVFLDLIPPMVELHSPVDGAMTKASSMRVLGRVGDDAVEVYLNGKMVLDIPFIDEVMLLDEGVNRIELRARDIYGNEAVSVVSVTLDTTPPDLSITDPPGGYLRTNSSRVVLRGLVGDDAVELTVLGEEVEFSAGGFEHPIVLSDDGTHEVIVEAIDAIGNIMRKVVRFDFSATPPSLTVSYHPSSSAIRADRATITLVGDVGRGVTNISVIVANRGSVTTTVHSIGVDGGAFIIHVELAMGENVITLRIVDDYGNLNTSSPHSVTLREPDIEEQGISTSVIIGIALAALVFVLALLLIIARRKASEE